MFDIYQWHALPLSYKNKSCDVIVEKDFAKLIHIPPIHTESRCELQRSEQEMYSDL